MDLEARQGVRMPRAIEEAAKLVVLQHTVRDGEVGAGQRAQALDLRLEDRAVRLGHRDDAPRERALLHRVVQRGQRLVVRIAPDLPTGPGLDEPGGDAYRVRRGSHTAAQDVSVGPAGERGAGSIAGALCRNDE
jgi:hypothetical protein